MKSPSSGISAFLPMMMVSSPGDQLTPSQDHALHHGRADLEGAVVRGSDSYLVPAGQRVDIGRLQDSGHAVKDIDQLILAEPNMVASLEQLPFGA
jgi:hypothetical protein